MSGAGVGLHLRLFQGRYTVSRLPATTPLPPLSELSAAIPGVESGPLVSVTQVGHELSVVAPEELLLANLMAPTVSDEAALTVRLETGWRVLEVAGPLEFSLTGVLASLVGPLARAGISVFTLSTFDTDYLLVKAATLTEARTALEAAGHRIEERVCEVGS